MTRSHYHREFYFTFILVVASAIAEKLLSKNENDHFFQTINEEYVKFNHLSAYISWKSSLHPSEDLADLNMKLGSIRTAWRNRVCSMAGAFDYNDLSKDESKQIYLLCRGPKYTPYQTKELSKLLNKLQAIYTTSEVCVHKNVSLTHLYEQTIIRNPTVIRKMIPETPLLFDLPLLELTEDLNIVSYPQYNMEDVELSEQALQEYLCFNGEPDLEHFMTGRYWKMIGADTISTNDQNRLLRWAWESWRFAVGPPIRTIFPEFIKILNIGAQNNGYSDMGEIWKEELEVPNLEEKCLELLEDVMPFYKLLHAFVRAGLSQKYNIRIPGHIPAHLLGNMWSQNWESLQDILISNNVDLDDSIKNNNWTAFDMVKRAEDFYTSMGLDKMTDNFWKYSSFEKENNGTKCHGTAANMFKKDDYRILLCADNTVEDFYVIHHEMGHIQYYMAYKDQPALLQDGTNSAFQESIGDAVMLGVMTPQHLNRLGLINDSTLFEKNNIRYKPQRMIPSRFRNARQKKALPKLSFDLILLLRQALGKIPQIPFGYILDKYRWSLFEGKVNNTNYNTYFWDLTRELQGIRPPDYRGEQFFDIAAKYHIPDNTPYIRYFLGSFLQAQIFRGLCTATVLGRPTLNELPMPLHRCDIYGSKKAGKVLRKMMSLGASVHWSEALEIVSKSKQLSAAPLLEYFAPIIEWLEMYIYENNIPIDW